MSERREEKDNCLVVRMIDLNMHTISYSPRVALTGDVRSKHTETLRGDMIVDLITPEQMLQEMQILAASNGKGEGATTVSLLLKNSGKLEKIE